MHVMSVLPSVSSDCTHSAVSMALLCCFSPHGTHTTQGLLWELSGGLYCNSVLHAFALLLRVYSVHVAQSEPRTNVGIHRLNPLLQFSPHQDSPHIARLQGLLLHIPQCFSPHAVVWVHVTRPTFQVKQPEKRKKKRMGIFPTLSRRQESLYLFLCPETRVNSQGFRCLCHR